LTPGGPAEKAGLKIDDVIIEYDGQRVQAREQLQRMVHESIPGHAVKLAVWRNGMVKNLEVTIENRRAAVEVTIPPGMWGDAPDFWPMMSFPVDIPRIQTVLENQALGVVCEPLGDEGQFAEFFGVKDGLLVKMVGANSAAGRAGIKAGDVIVKVDDTRVGTVRDMESALAMNRQKTGYQITVVRNKKEMTLAVQLRP
jgi:serine protease Do